MKPIKELIVNGDHVVWLFGLRKIDDYLIDLLRANNSHWLKRMIGFGKIKVEPTGFIGTKRNADLLVTILNPPYSGKQKVAVEVENDRKFDVDAILCKIKKDQPCPTIAIIPKEHEKDAWRFQESLITVWFWKVQCKWKCEQCDSVFTTTSSLTPNKCSNCNRGGRLHFEGVNQNDTPFAEANSNPSMPWGEIQSQLESLKPHVRTINYVKRRITSVYTDLIWGMGPPKNWEERIRSKDSNWNDYYSKIWNTKENALHNLETLVARYYDPLSASELIDDAVAMVELLENRTRWIMAEPNTTLKRDPLSLHTIAGDVVNVIFESIKMIKDHKLLHDPTHVLISYREGELPTMKRQKVTDVDTHIKRHYSFFEQILDESVKFRDETLKLVFKEKTEKK